MIKKLLLILVFSLLFALLPLSASAASESTSVPGGTVSSYDDLKNALGGDDTVILKEDHLLLLSDVCLEAPITITEGNFTIIGAGVVITASFSDDHWISVVGKGTSLVLGTEVSEASSENITFDGNSATYGASILSVGSGASLSFHIGTRFADIITTTSGAALRNSGTVTMYAGTIENCRSLSDGGAVYSEGELFLAAGTIKSCSAERGGAVYNDGTLHLIGTEITSCQAQQGGAVYNAATASLKSSTISDCHAERGGAVYNTNKMTLTGGQILNSAADSEGGAVYSAGDCLIEGTYVSENQAVLGGSVYNTGKLTVTNGSLSKGHAQDKGGNVYNAKEASMTVSGGMILDGSATVGGGIYNEGSLTLTGGSVTLNEATFASGILNYGQLFFSEKGYANKSNEIWLVATEDQAHIVKLVGELMTKIPGTLRLVVPTASGFETSQTIGDRFVDTSGSSSSASYFAVAADGNDYYLTDDGRLEEKLPVYSELWFYVILILIFAVFVAIIVFVVRYFDRRKGSVKV